METIQIVRRTLVVPEPKELWIADPKEKRKIVLETKRLWANFRSNFGFKIPKNLSELVFGTMPNSNKKLNKSEELIFGLSLAQNNLSGINVCHWSTPECRKACVGKNGNNGFPMVMQAKIAKTKFLFEYPKEAGILLADFWDKAEKKRLETNKEVGGRLNTFSDINWIEVAPWIFDRFKDISYYDYTKQWDRISPFKNYHLTYSASERTIDDEIIDCVSQGNNVAVVFGIWGKKPLPPEYLGFPVIDGDKDDVRWKDPIGVIVGLRRKGSLKVTSPMVKGTG